MERRKFITATAVAVTAGSISTVLAATTEKKGPVYNHYLLFWLKKDLSEKEVEDFTGFFKILSTLPYVKSIQYGKPANSSPRKVVDNSFTYNLVIQFGSLEDLEAYGKLPVHLAAIKKYSVYWDRMIVHDSILS
ncbi:Dabb family protein [Pedobacter sp. AW31-3R]|uniref:Dabb family protein n=1 Tax=Pedobacter sp. AW31-3R TaxID=3445781 RepID=UPI003F9F2A24